MHTFLVSNSQTDSVGLYTVCMHLIIVICDNDENIFSVCSITIELWCHLLIVLLVGVVIWEIRSFSL